MPDRFLVGLAVLGFLSEVAGERPLVCVVDDEQWLDRASAQVLGFVARRLAAEPVGLVFAARLPGDELTGLPELAVKGLPEGDARALLASVLAGPLDARVRDQMVAETRGNPLALLELPRGLTPAELAGGFGLPATVPLLGRIEESFRRRIEDLPKESRLLVLIVAAEPTGDSSLVWRAAGRLGIGVQAAVPAAEAGLVEFGAQVRFRHPLVRSAAYRLASAQDLQEVHRALAEATDQAAYLEALWGAAMWAGDLDIPGGARAAAEAALGAPPGPAPPRVADVLLDAFARRLTEGHAAAAPELARALELVLALDFGTDETGRWLWLAGGRISQIIALELWDIESWHALATRQAQFARGAGALVHLQFALNYLARAHLLAGDLATAALMIEEDRLIAEATGNPPVAHNAMMMLAAWRGWEREASELIEASMQGATARGLGRLASFAAYASAVLNNGLGRHDAACDVARQAFDRDQLGYGPLVIPELAEAASRTGDVVLVTAALEWLSERTRVMPTEWALGIEARIRALLSDGEAEPYYRESIERLGRTRVRAELARGHLLYGEWLRRERRRGEAREHLRTAHQMLDAMGIGAFAERARRELLATGEAARKRTVETAVELTAQEAQVARLARAGLSNPQIGARLFISTRTVQYHLGKVFTKLGISSRGQLDQALPADRGADPSR